MRILIHGINFTPELTGVGKYTGEMTEWLASRGHEIRIVTTPPYYPNWVVEPGYRARRYAVETRGGVRVWRCPLWVPQEPSGLKRLLHVASFVASSLPVMLGQLFWRPDVVFVVEPSLLCGPTALLVARLCGAAAWLHIQDFEADAAFELGLLRGSLLRRVVTTWECWLMHRFDRVSTISRRMLDRAQLKGVRSERLFLLPNWADLMTPSMPTQTQMLREKLDVPPASVLALYSGTMGRKQGLELLSQAATRLQDTQKLVFVFCGNGPGREELTSQCSGLRNVRFLNLQPVDHLKPLLAMADIHLLPQQAGAADLVMPSKLTGMMASGRPVIATCPEGTELAAVVRNRGFVTPPGDPEAFADAIRNLVDDQELRTRLGANAQAYADEHLSRENILAAFQSALEQLANR